MFDKNFRYATMEFPLYFDRINQVLLNLKKILMQKKNQKSNRQAVRKSAEKFKTDPSQENYESLKALKESSRLGFDSLGMGKSATAIIKQLYGRFENPNSKIKTHKTSNLMLPVEMV
ncbi:MAG: hypothetical protein WC795_00800 [Candidatus Paceibacterota bacterium]|jgi:hypothetical protein